MSGFLDKFREKIYHSVWKDNVEERPQVQIDDKIALGVLLLEVAQSDNKVLPQEKAQMIDVLKKYGAVSEEDMPVVLESIEAAYREKIDLHTFTREVSQDLPYDKKIEVIENLFRISCADGELAHEEHETIRKISGLLRLDHKDFIDAKIKIKKELDIKDSRL